MHPLSLSLTLSDPLSPFPLFWQSKMLYLYSDNFCNYNRALELLTSKTADKPKLSAFLEVCSNPLFLPPPSSLLYGT